MVLNNYGSILLYILILVLYIDVKGYNRREKNQSGGPKFESRLGTPTDCSSFELTALRKYSNLKK
jgi:hypothetical protein